jgi:hypothetical protein
MIFYFTYWFPPFHRARIVAGFMSRRSRCRSASARRSRRLAPVDGLLGVAGWRWLFLCGRRRR